MGSQILHGAIAAILALSLAACAGQIVNNSKKDPDYQNKISDVDVIFDVTYYQHALMQTSLGNKNALSQLGQRMDALNALTMAIKSSVENKLSDANVKNEFHIASDNTFPFIQARNSKPTKSIMASAYSGSSKEILLISFSSYETVSRNSEHPVWDGNITLRIKLLDKQSPSKDLDMGRTVWVAETRQFLLSPDVCMSDQFYTCADRMVSAIVDRLVADGLLNSTLK